jgi:xanthine dehydrogenase molybdenum-binding subunit
MNNDRREKKTARAIGRPQTTGTEAAPLAKSIRIIVNGKPCELIVGREIEACHTLAHTLRETLGLTGTKIACDHGGCCSCTVLMDGEPILSCITLTIECDGKSIITIEGLKDRKSGELNKLQQSFVSHSAFQCGFCTPGMVMSGQALLDRSPVPTDDEITDALSGHYCRCISHYEVVGAVKDAARGTAESAPPGPNRHIGKGTPRVDAEAIVSGEASFISDIRLPGMLFGKVLRSPFPHANILKIETSAAEALPGVEAVLTYENVPDWKAGNPRYVPVLEKRLRFVGDGVALVAATSEEIAEEALRLIRVEYEELAPVFDVEEAMRPGSPQLYSQFPGNVAPRGFLAFGPNTLQEVVRGDVESGFKEADLVSEGTYGYECTPNPLPAEPPGAIAMWEAPDKVIIWSATQSPFLVRNVMSIAMGGVDIRSIASQCGGSFGSKNCATKPIFYAAALARAVGKGRPVRVAYTRQEHFSAYAVRFGSRIHGKVGIKKDGTVTAFSGDWLINTGNCATSTQGQVAVGLGEAQLMLRCANWNLQPYVVFTNQTASGAVRGFGGQELKSAFLPILMLALEKANLDPVDFFKSNFVHAGDGYFWRDGNWWTCKGVDYRKAAEAGARAFGWKEKWKGWLKPTAIESVKRIGVGCGVHGNADVGEDHSEAYVRLLPNGRAVLQACVAESGGGQRSSVRKMVAEVLGLSLDRVTITAPDTLINPFEHGLAGSRGTYATGSAVTIAAMDAKAKLMSEAAAILHKDAADLETSDGMVFEKGGSGKPLPWLAVIGTAERTITGFGSFVPDYSMPNFLMTFVEVEVDIETGMVELRRITNATDVGRIIDPAVLEGQLHGALGSAGIDTALSEESVLDPATGRVLNCNMVDYKWRTFIGLPEFDNVVLETPLPTHIYGALGVGEISTSPGPSAVLMAVSNAIGKRMTRYPLTPDRILEALHEEEKTGQ